MLAPGTTVGRFRIERLIGEGGMGLVYEATDLRLGRRVALKVLRPAGGDGRVAEEDLAQLEIEARTAAVVSHPALVTVYSFERLGPLALIEMELVAGQTLAARLEQGPLTHQEAHHILVAITVGVAAAHRSGVIHLDLKPANVMIQPDGRVRILDFGISRVGPSVPGGQIRGTPAYMAPEQFGPGALTPAADVWAVGAIAVHMLTGARPYEGHDAHAIASQVMAGPPRAVADAGFVRVAGGLARIVSRCFGVGGLRYPDAHVLLQALATAPDEPPLPVASAPATAPSPDVGMRRLRVGALLAAVLVFASLAGLAWVQSTTRLGRTRSVGVGGGVNLGREEPVAADSAQPSVPAAPPTSLPPTTAMRLEVTAERAPVRSAGTDTVRMHGAVEPSPRRVPLVVKVTGVPDASLAGIDIRLLSAFSTPATVIGQANTGPGGTVEFSVEPGVYLVETGLVNGETASLSWRETVEVAPSAVTAASIHVLTPATARIAFTDRRSMAEENRTPPPAAPPVVAMAADGRVAAERLRAGLAALEGALVANDPAIANQVPGLSALGISGDLRARRILAASCGAGSPQEVGVRWVLSFTCQVEIDNRFSTKRKVVSGTLATRWSGTEWSAVVVEPQG
ncbi:MAG: serine/threonine protein kinase [Gemmatimonadetes bacterium]|nr:serine/threonine protein kinase [Gemmatimonadota bacterium]